MKHLQLWTALRICSILRNTQGPDHPCFIELLDCVHMAIDTDFSQEDVRYTYERACEEAGFMIWISDRVRERMDDEQ